MRIIASIGLTITLIVLLTSWFVWYPSNQITPDALQPIKISKVQISPVAQQQPDAEAYRLAAQALLTMDDTGDGLVRSTLLAIESLQHEPTLEGEQALRQGVALLPYPVTEIDIGGEWVQNISFNPVDHSQLVVGGSNLKQNGTLRIWNVETGKEVNQIQYGLGSIQDVVFSTDGQWLITGGINAQVWEVDTGREVARMIPENPTGSVIFSPDGRWLAAGSRVNHFRIIQVWDVMSKREVLRIDKIGGEKQHMAFSPDGQWLAAISEGRVKLWEVGKWQNIVWTEPISFARSVAFSPNSQWLALGGVPQTKILETTTGQVISQLPDISAPDIMAFSPYNNRWLATSTGSYVQIWDAETGKMIAWIPLVDTLNRVNALTFSPNGHMLAIASEDGTARLWQVPERGLITHIKEIARLVHDSEVKSVAFSPDGDRLATGNADGKIRIWETPEIKQTGQRIPIFSSNTGSPIIEMAFSPDNNWFLRSTSGMCSNGFCPSSTRVWEVTFKDEQLIVDQTSPILKFDGYPWPPDTTFSYDSQWLATILAGGQVSVWQMDTVQEIGRFGQNAHIVALSSQGQWLATANDYIVEIWDVAANEKLKGIAAKNNISALSFSPNDQWVVGSQTNNQVQVWDVTTGQRVTQLTHEEQIKVVVFSPDGQWLAIGSGINRHHDNGPDTVQIWQTGSWKRGVTLDHGIPVESIVFSPNSRWLATQSRDTGVTRVWDVATGREVTQVTHNEKYRSGRRTNTVTFNSDSRLVTADAGIWVRNWLLKSEDLIADGCTRLPRNLTREEWQQYVGEETYRSTCSNLPPEE